ncbi:MAG: mechanosensitive ion channel [Flavobacteriales bacterium]|nr:mechanosensitive ion channel [Flavobacteriales bacterium]
MENLAQLSEQLMGSFAKYGSKIVDFLPTILMAIVLFLVGWLVAKIVAGIVHRALKAVNFDEIVKKVNLDKMLAKIKPDISSAQVLSRIVYWLIMLLVFTSTADFMGWDMVTAGISSFFAYLPTLLVAMILFIIGVYIADLVKNMVYTAANSIGISGAGVIANIVYYVLFIFIAITALNQAGVDTSIITSNVTIIMGSILLAFALSYGIASRGLVTNLLSSYYSKGKFRVGQHIKVADHEGTIEQIDSISFTLNTGTSLLVMPSKILIEGPVEIIEQPNDQTQEE